MAGKGGLTDARLADERNHLAVSGRGPTQCFGEGMKLAPAPDQGHHAKMHHAGNQQVAAGRSANPVDITGGLFSESPKCSFGDLLILSNDRWPQRAPPLISTLPHV